MAKHELHRHAERRVARLDIGIDRFQIIEQGRPAIPGHGGGAARDIVAGQRRHRDGGDLGKAEARGHDAELRLDGAEALLRPVDQIHLVDGEHDLLDADEVADGGVAAGLALGAMARIDQQDRHIGVRRAGRHVARILLMARGIDDDEAPVRRLEIAPGDVDGDALLALGLEPVEQEAEIDLLAVEQAVLRGMPDGRALVLGDRGRVPQQPADQRRLAVVDRAAGQEPHHGAGLRRAGGATATSSLSAATCIRNNPHASSSPWRPPDRGRSAALPAPNISRSTPRPPRRRCRSHRTRPRR